MKKLILLTFVLMCSCNKEKEEEPKVNKNPSTDPDVVALPEPSVVEQNSARFKLTQLSAVPEKFFKINDNIVFTGLDKQMQEEKFLKDVKLKIKTHCIVNKDEVLIQEFTRTLSQSIPIIELLPISALSQTEAYPSCGFSFKAEHKGGAAHHFNLPPLPIMDHTQSRFIKIEDSSEKMSTAFPYVLMETINNYWMDIGNQEPINRLNLICDDFSIALSFRPQQFIPLSAFPFKNLTEEIKETVKNKNHNQQCRVFGYRNKTLVGVSSIFHLLYPRSPLSIYVDDDVLSEEEKYHFFFKIMHFDGSEKEDRPDIPIYSYNIKNPHPYPVHILIEDYKERELYWNIYGLYYSRESGISFYERHEDMFTLDGIQTTEGKTAQKQTDKGILITMEPGSQITFNTVLTNEFDLCTLEYNEHLIYLGAVVRYPDLKIYQLISDQLDAIPLEQNIQHQLNNRAGRGFTIVTSHLREGFEKKFRAPLWFRQGLCYRDYLIAKPQDPIIELYGRGRVRHRWIDFTPLQQQDYRRTNHLIREHFEGVTQIKPN